MVTTFPFGRLSTNFSSRFLTGSYYTYIPFPAVSQLFYAIVALFRLVCRLTGLSYAELNILVYCALVPMGWLLLVVWRRKSLWPWLLGQFGVLLALLILRRGHLGPPGQRFYDYNIAVLEKLGHATGGGYLAVSLLMGVMGVAQ